MKMFLFSLRFFNINIPLASGTGSGGAARAAAPLTQHQPRLWTNILYMGFDSKPISNTVYTLEVGEAEHVFGSANEPNRVRKRWHTPPPVNKLKRGWKRAHVSPPPSTN